MSSPMFSSTSNRGGLWGGLTFDIGGAFGGRLIGMTTAASVPGYVERRQHLAADLGRRLEGVTVAPASFGARSPDR